MRERKTHKLLGYGTVCGALGSYVLYSREWKRVNCNRCLSVLAQKQTVVRAVKR